MTRPRLAVPTGASREVPKGLPESALRRKRRLIRWMSTQHPHKIIARMGKPIALRAKAHDTGRRREAGPVVRVDVFVGAHNGGGIYAACWCCQANVGLMGRRSEGHAPGETPAGSVEETPARRSAAGSVIAPRPAAQQPRRQEQNCPQQLEHRLQPDSQNPERQRNDPDQRPQQQRKQRQWPAEDKEQNPEEYT